MPQVREGVQMDEEFDKSLENRVRKGTERVLSLLSPSY